MPAQYALAGSSGMGRSVPLRLLCRTMMAQASLVQRSMMLLALVLVSNPEPCKVHSPEPEWGHNMARVCLRKANWKP